MTHDQDHDRKRRDLLRLFREFNAVSSNLQIEMSKALITNPEAHAHLRRQLAGTENQMEEVMDNATKHFVSAMPLATMNRCNMFARVLGMHSDLTGDGTMHEVLDAINEEVLADFGND